MRTRTYLEITGTGNRVEFNGYADSITRLNLNGRRYLTENLSLPDSKSFVILLTLGIIMGIGYINRSRYPPSNYDQDNRDIEIMDMTDDTMVSVNDGNPNLSGLSPWNLLTNAFQWKRLTFNQDNGILLFNIPYGLSRVYEVTPGGLQRLSSVMRDYDRDMSGDPLFETIRKNRLHLELICLASNPSEIYRASIHLDGIIGRFHPLPYSIRGLEDIDTVSSLAVYFRHRYNLKDRDYRDDDCKVPEDDNCEVPKDNNGYGILPPKGKDAHGNSRNENYEALVRKEISTEEESGNGFRDLITETVDRSKELNYRLVLLRLGSNKPILIRRTDSKHAFDVMRSLYRSYEDRSEDGIPRKGSGTSEDNGYELIPRGRGNLGYFDSNNLFKLEENPKNLFVMGLRYLGDSNPGDTSEACGQLNGMMMIIEGFGHNYKDLLVARDFLYDVRSEIRNWIEGPDDTIEHGRIGSGQDNEKVCGAVPSVSNTSNASKPIHQGTLQFDGNGSGSTARYYDAIDATMRNDTSIYGDQQSDDSNEDNLD